MVVTPCGSERSHGLPSCPLQEVVNAGVTDGTALGRFAGNNKPSMRAFRLQLIVTAIVLAAAIVFGLVTLTVIHKAKISDRQKVLRVQKLGTGTAMISLLIIAPFWLVAASKVGAARRKARENAQTPPDAAP